MVPLRAEITVETPPGKLQPALHLIPVILLTLHVSRHTRQQHHRGLLREKPLPDRWFGPRQARAQEKTPPYCRAYPPRLRVPAHSNFASRYIRSLDHPKPKTFPPHPRGKLPGCKVAEASSPEIQRPKPKTPTPWRAFVETTSPGLGRY